MLKRLLNLVTDDGTLSMQRRLFRMICLTTTFLCAIIIPINALQSLPPVINVSVLLFALFTLYLFRETYRGRDHVIAYYVALLLVLNTTWFPNGGSTGSIIYYFAATLIYPMSLMRGALRWSMVSLLVLDASALMVIEHLIPSLAVPFESSTARLIDLLTGVFCSSLAGVAALWVVITNYDWERAAIARVSRDPEISEKNYREVVESANAAIVRMDRDGMITFFNSFAESLFGFNRTKIVGVSINTIFPDAADVDGGNRPRIERILRDPSHEVQFESRNIRSDGRIVWLNWTIQPIFDVRGELAEFLCIGADITEHKALDEKRKQFDQEMVQVQKIESLGTLAGGIAHDFNNFIATILGNIALVRMDLDPKSEEYSRLTEAEKASLHARDLTSQLLTFSQGGLPVTRAIAIGSLLRDSLTFSLSGSNVAGEISIPHDLWHIYADSGQLGQVFNNLIINACQAMPSGGTVTVEASNVSVSEQDEITLPEGRYVTVTVRDEGTGIKDEHLPKIFDPYFTTKQSSSGLGLAVAYSIIKNHHGHIAVRSKVGEGSVFMVHLPAAADAPGKQPISEGAGASIGARILVMDDEVSVRNIVGSILKRYGYTAAFAGDGEEAIEIYKRARAAGQSFDIVLMDLTIPGGMGGKEAIAHLRELDPGVRVVATSGYSNDPIMAQFRDYGFLGVIAKPYLPAELNELLQSVLRNTAPPSTARPLPA